MARTNNKLYVRGRFTRDPLVTDAKDGSGRKMLFGRLAVDQPYTDGKGDVKTSTTYCEIKVFDDKLARALIDGDAKKGTLVEATGMARIDRSDYEKDGEPQVAHNLAVVLDDAGAHSVSIEAQPRAAA